MTARVPLTFACGRYDRVAPIADGRVAVEGCALNLIHLEPEECFWRMLQGEEFDAAEMSLGSYCMLRARGDERFVAIPAFLSRSFRHNAIYVRDDGSVDDAADLAGTAVGVPEYQMTAAVWIRGILQHDGGLDLSTVRWRTGGLDQPGRIERQPLMLANDFDVAPIPSDQTLTEQLLAGELAAITCPRVPAPMRRGEGIRRLYPDYAARELDYFQRTGFFPIMHTVVVRRELADEHPWLPTSLYKALQQAKSVATSGLAEAPALAYTIPFLLDTLERQRAVFGADPWPYGLEPNRRELEHFVALLHEQGLLAGALDVDELFHPGTRRESRI